MQRETENPGTGIQIQVYMTLDKLPLGFLTFEMGMMTPIHGLGVPGKNEMLHK